MSKTGNLTALSAVFTSSEPPTIYYAEDPPYLPRILILYWPVQAVGSFASASRVRITILSAAGFKSFPAFSVAPSSSYYAAVHKLPAEKQRDDVCRAVAFTLFRYFSEVSPDVKNAIMDENLQHGIEIKWGQTHAAQITDRMSKVTNVDEVLEVLRPFHKDRTPPSPTPLRSMPSSIRKTRPSFLPQETAPRTALRQSTAITPHKRTPSSQGKGTPFANSPPNKYKPVTPLQKNTMDQLESLRFKMCEFVDTEDRYISRLQELTNLVTNQGLTPKSLSSKFAGSKSQKAMNAMLTFPSLLDSIRDLNLAFLDDIESALHGSEESALLYLDQLQHNNAAVPPAKDPIGINAFSKVMLNHFPKFLVPYRDYLDLHSQISSNLEQFLRNGTSSNQQAPSLLMEPAQRISRYGLYIDTMLPHLLPTSTVAIRTLEKARKIIAEICEMEPAASTILDSLRIEHEVRRRPLSPVKLLSGLTRSNGTIREAPATVTSVASITASTNTLKDRDTPRLFPSLSRSLSRKNKSRPALNGILSEQDPDQASNLRSSRNDENRPLTSSSNISFGSVAKRPPTSGSATTSSGMQPPSPTGNIEFYKAAVMRLEEENYKLLHENADLKRQVRECRCRNGM